MHHPISLRGKLSWLALPVALLATASAVAATIPHDQVQPIPAAGEAFLFKFQPYLKVEDGCVPFPAVDAQGNTSGGLKASGARNGGCSASTGQVYARALTYNGDCAVMYSWYFPKDQVIDGHRHDWENAVVWLSDCSSNASIRAVSYSAHSGYEKTVSPPTANGRPLVRYYTDGFTNHKLGSTGSQGGSQPLIQWEALPAAARTALTDTSFGDANVPMKDANFINNLAKAYYK
ncbi:MAG: NPP1 family protein [Sphingobium sp.]